MKKFIEEILFLPKWYGCIVILIYAVLAAELVSSISSICISYEMQISGVIKTFVQINYIATMFSCIIVWAILSFLYHLTALLFGGKAVFEKFLLAASYPFILPAIMVIIALLLLDNVEVGKYDDISQFMERNSSYKMAIDIVNCSFIPYYLLVACIIHYLYNLKWLYALLSVAIPVVSIYGVTELFEFIM